MSFLYRLYAGSVVLIYSFVKHLLIILCNFFFNLGANFKESGYKIEYTIN